MGNLFRLLIEGPGLDPGFFYDLLDGFRTSEGGRSVFPSSSSPSSSTSGSSP